MLSRKFFDRYPSVILADDADDVGLCEATLAHRWISLRARLGGNPHSPLAPDFGPIPRGDGRLRKLQRLADFQR
jgi:hypothetical protein